jgi:hypothetical protein
MRPDVVTLTNSEHLKKSCEKILPQSGQGDAIRFWAKNGMRALMKLENQRILYIEGKIDKLCAAVALHRWADGWKSTCPAIVGRIGNPSYGELEIDRVASDCGTDWQSVLR